MSHHITTLQINTGALKHNLTYFKDRLKASTKIMAVVKAYGYGGDGVLTAQALKDTVDYFAVAYTHEGIALRNAGIKNPILVLHPHPQNFEELNDHCLEPSLYNFTSLKAYLKFSAKEGLQNTPIHLKFNTGLNRLGFQSNEVDEALKLCNEAGTVYLQSIFSHLAASEDANEKEFTELQLKRFTHIKKNVYSLLKHQPIAHMLNTSGVINYPEAQFDMVRIGIGLYGFGNDASITKELQFPFTLTSVISQIHTIEPNQTVGYNRAFSSTTTTRTATIPIGHADGIPRAIGNGKSYVWIHNKKAPIIGNVCMDMIMVDVTSIDCNEGDEVTIFRSQEDVLQIASASNTISYEVITGISQRVERNLI